MKSILFNKNVTKVQVSYIKRKLMNSGASSIQELSGDRVILLIEDPANLIDFDEYKLLENVESILSTFEKNIHVTNDIPSINIQSGIDDKMIIAGPCGVESEEQVAIIYKHLSKEGLRYVRGGAYKPRTSPHDFQGLGKSGLLIASDIARDYGLQLISEIVDPRDVEFASRYISVIQIGTRSMQNFPLLKEASQSGLPILLKRGMSATVEEWIGAGEHCLVAGSPLVIFCERGIRTYESITRNTLDILGAVALKERTKMPVIIDPSHAAGRRSLVIQAGLAGIASGLDGIIVEVHNDPASAKSDASQALPLDEFTILLNKARAINEVLTMQFN